MSFEAMVQLPPGVRRRAAADLLAGLGFVRVPISPYWKIKGGFWAFSWHEVRDYRSYSGAYAELAEQQGQLALYLRTNIWASYWDVAKQNECLRALRRSFGASFESDFGRNRYFPLPEGPPTPVEAGCRLAFWRFESSMGRSVWYLSNRNFPEQFKTVWNAQALGANNPWVLSNNFLLPFVVATMEDYFKSTFIALLRYSGRKATVLKGARLSGEQLAEISAGARTVEECFAENMSFQDLGAVSDHLKTVEPKLDVRGVLRKRVGRRKQTLFEAVSQVVRLRHQFVHHGAVHEEFNDSAVRRSLRDVFVSVDRVHGRVAEIHGWRYKRTSWGRNIRMHQDDDGRRGV